MLRQTVELPRSTKRLISICADSVMIPLALWAALSLKAGQPAFSLADWPAYLAVVAISIPIFVRLGLYRAVIRFLGHKAVFAVALAVALSGVFLAILGAALKLPALSLERRDHLFLPRAALCRGLALRGALLPAHPLHSADRGASGHLRGGRRRRALVHRPVDHPRIRSGGLHRRQQEPARPDGQRHQGLPAGRAAGADQEPQHRPDSAGAAVSDPPPPARDLERARALGRARANRPGIRAAGDRQGERRATFAKSTCATFWAAIRSRRRRVCSMPASATEWSW